MYSFRVRLALFSMLLLIVWGYFPSKGSEVSGQSLTSTYFARSSADESENRESRDIQWFREEMKISPKYLEQDEGILGMSWTHFFTMVFLVLFFLAAVVVVVMRNVRTKQLLNRLLEEEERRAPDS